MIRKRKGIWKGDWKISRPSRLQTMTQFIDYIIKIMNMVIESS